MKNWKTPIGVAATIMIGALAIIPFIGVVAEIHAYNKLVAVVDPCFVSFTSECVLPRWAVGLFSSRSRVLLGRVTSVHLSRNPPSHIVDAVAAIPNLQTLWCNGLPEEEAIKAISNGGISQLTIADGQLTNVTLQTIGALRKLKVLSLCRCQLDSLCEGDWKCIESLHNLQEVTMSGTPIDDYVLASFARLPRLTSLTLRDTGVSDAGVQHLRSNKTLTTLDLSRTNISDTAIGDLSLVKLHTLLIGETRATADCLPAVSKLGSLRCLEMPLSVVREAPIQTALTIKSLPAMDTLLFTIGEKESLKEVDELRNSFPSMRIGSYGRARRDSDDRIDGRSVWMNILRNDKGHNPLVDIVGVSVSSIDSTQWHIDGSITRPHGYGNNSVRCYDERGSELATLDEIFRYNCRVKEPASGRNVVFFRAVETLGDWEIIGRSARVTMFPRPDGMEIEIVDRDGVQKVFVGADGRVSP